MKTLLKTFILVGGISFAMISAQAGSFGVNMASNNSLSGTLSGTTDGPKIELQQNNWNNWNADTNDWVLATQYLATGDAAPSGITVSWSYNGGSSEWGGIDNNGDILSSPGAVSNSLDYTGVGGQYDATVTLSHIPLAWGATTLTLWGLGDDYGGGAGNRWDISGSPITITPESGPQYLEITFSYPGGDGRNGGFIKAVQLSGDSIVAVPEPSSLLLLGMGGLLGAVRRRRSIA